MGGRAERAQRRAMLRGHETDDDSSEHSDNNKDSKSKVNSKKSKEKPLSRGNRMRTKTEQSRTSKHNNAAKNVPSNETSTESISKTESKHNDYDEPEPQNPLMKAQSMWEIPSIAMILNALGPHLMLSSFRIRDLEEALVNIHNSDLANEIFTKLLLEKQWEKAKFASGEGLPFAYWALRLKHEFEDWFARWSSLQEKIALHEKHLAELDDATSVSTTRSISHAQTIASPSDSEDDMPSSREHFAVEVTPEETEEEYKWRSLLVDIGRSNPMESCGIGDLQLEWRVIVLKTLIEERILPDKELGKKLRALDESDLRYYSMGIDVAGAHYFAFSQSGNFRICRQTFRQVSHGYSHSVRRRRQRCPLPDSTKNRAETETEDGNSSDSSVDDFAGGGIIFGHSEQEPQRFGWTVLTDSAQQVQTFLEHMSDKMGDKTKQPSLYSDSPNSIEAAEALGTKTLLHKLHKTFSGLSEKVDQERRRQNKAERKEMLRAMPRRVSGRLAALEQQRDEKEAKQEDTESDDKQQRLLNIAEEIEGRRLRKRIVGRMSKTKRKQTIRNALFQAWQARYEAEKVLSQCRLDYLKSSAPISKHKVSERAANILSQYSKDEMKVFHGYNLDDLHERLSTAANIGRGRYLNLLERLPNAFGPHPSLLIKSIWYTPTKEEMDSNNDIMMRETDGSNISLQNEFPVAKDGSPLYLAFECARHVETASKAAHILPYHDTLCHGGATASILVSTNPKSVYADSLRSSLLKESKTVFVTNIKRLLSWQTLESQWRRIEQLHVARKSYKDALQKQAHKHNISLQAASKFVSVPSPLLYLFQGRESELGYVVASDWDTRIGKEIDTILFHDQEWDNQGGWLKTIQTHPEGAFSETSIVSAKDAAQTSTVNNDISDSTSHNVNHDETERLSSNLMTFMQHTVPDGLSEDAIETSYDAQAIELKHMQSIPVKEAATQIQQSAAGLETAYITPVSAFVGRAILPLSNGPNCTSFNVNHAKEVSALASIGEMELSTRLPNHFTVSDSSKQHTTANSFNMHSKLSRDPPSTRTMDKNQTSQSENVQDTKQRINTCNETRVTSAPTNEMDFADNDMMQRVKDKIAADALDICPLGKRSIVREYDWLLSSDPSALSKMAANACYEDDSEEVAITLEELVGPTDPDAKLSTRTTRSIDFATHTLSSGPTTRPSTVAATAASSGAVHKSPGAPSKSRFTQNPSETDLLRGFVTFNVRIKGGVYYGTVDQQTSCLSQSPLIAPVGDCYTDLESKSSEVTLPASSNQSQEISEPSNMTINNSSSSSTREDTVGNSTMPDTVGPPPIEHSNSTPSAKSTRQDTVGRKRHRSMEHISSQSLQTSSDSSPDRPAVGPPQRASAVVSSHALKQARADRSRTRPNLSSVSTTRASQRPPMLTKPSRSTEQSVTHPRIPGGRLNELHTLDKLQSTSVATESVRAQAPLSPISNTHTMSYWNNRAPSSLEQERLLSLPSHQIVSDNNKLSSRGNRLESHTAGMSANHTDDDARSLVAQRGPSPSSSEHPQPAMQANFSDEASIHSHSHSIRRNQSRSDDIRLEQVHSTSAGVSNPDTTLKSFPSRRDDTIRPQASRMMSGTSSIGATVGASDWDDSSVSGISDAEDTDRRFLRKRQSDDSLHRSRTSRKLSNHSNVEEQGILLENQTSTHLPQTEDRYTGTRTETVGVISPDSTTDHLPQGTESPTSTTAVKRATTRSKPVQYAAIHSDDSILAPQSFRGSVLLDHRMESSQGIDTSNLDTGYHDHTRDEENDYIVAHSVPSSSHASAGRGSIKSVVDDLSRTGHDQPINSSSGHRSVEFSQNGEHASVDGVPDTDLEMMDAVSYCGNGSTAAIAEASSDNEKDI